MPRLASDLGLSSCHLLPLARTDGVMASDSTWYTTTLDLTAIVDEPDRTVTTEVLVVSPPNKETAWSTWYIGPSFTYESYTTWVEGKSTTEGSTINKKQQTTEQEQTTTEQTAVQPTPTSTGSVNHPSASSNSSAAETPDRQSSHSSGGISDGALAGAIVGSVVGTALVTLLLAFLFFRRRRSKPAKEVDDGAFAGAATRHRKSKSKSGSAFPLADIIPQPEPADDDTVRRRILTLVDQAGLHIDNYYVPGSTPAHLSAEQSARLAVYNSTDLPAPIQALLAQREIRRQTLKYALVRTILRAIIPGGNGTGELLPRAFADMPVVEGRSGTLPLLSLGSRSCFFLDMRLTISSFIRILCRSLQLAHAHSPPPLPSIKQHHTHNHNHKQQQQPKQQNPHLNNHNRRLPNPSSRIPSWPVHSRIQPVQFPELHARRTHIAFGDSCLFCGGFGGLAILPALHV